MPKHYLFLVAAILAEVVGTSALKASGVFTRFWPSTIVVVGYALSFYLLALTFKYMQVGIVYAIWSGLGIVVITLIGAVAFGEKIDMGGMLGMGLIIAGVLVIHLFSNTGAH